MGDPVAEDMRYVVRAVVGEENFVDMTPNRSNNYCCGGGGGFLQNGLPDQRRAFGKLKFDQIMSTGATYCITPCHNCHAQIHDLSEHFEGGYHSVHLWTLICLNWQMWMCCRPRNWKNNSANYAFILANKKTRPQKGRVFLPFILNLRIRRRRIRYSIIYLPIAPYKFMPLLIP